MSVNNLSDREFIEEYKKSSFRLSIADIVTDIFSLSVLMLYLSGIITSIALFIVFPLFCIYSAIENIPSDKLVLCISFNFAVFIFLLGILVEKFDVDKYIDNAYDKSENDGAGYKISIE